ncbi:hypothetical protein [Klebsiella pneumoniae]|uniref:hypothetical protein n=2 Tax=Klebsiella pneumoniae TaxID=573 RepID=UPI001D0D57C9|nr:hypothetical protein [Klebsiella pneumoniae]
MMKFKTNSFLFMMLCATALNSWAGYYNTIDIDGVSIHLDKDKAGYVNVHDDQLNTDYSCKIENWNDSLISGAGGISLTSDHLGVLLASGNKYVDVKELIDCKGQSIRIHSIHYFNNSISSIIDVNFEKKLVLALVVIDAHFRSYQAIVSKEGANKQVISSQADSLIKISRIWADFFPANNRISLFRLFFPPFLALFPVFTEISPTDVSFGPPETGWPG